jgi:hypothetical protein
MDEHPCASLRGNCPAIGDKCSFGDMAGVLFIILGANLIIS